MDLKKHKEATLNIGTGTQGAWILVNSASDDPPTWEYFIDSIEVSYDTIPPNGDMTYGATLSGFPT
jgi:hypothetical protein